jgi:hypothetical protein
MQQHKIMIFIEVIKVRTFPLLYEFTTSKSQFQNAPFCPISASGSNFPRNTKCIPAVKIIAFLDLGQT